MVGEHGRWTGLTTDNKLWRERIERLVQQIKPHITIYGMNLFPQSALLPILT